MSQPAASYAIARLEALFGAPLLIRNAGGSALTPAGELLHVRTRRFFALLAEGLSEVCTDEARRMRLIGAIRSVHIRGLIAVAEAGTFTNAAKQLNVSGPALHRVVREFEKLLRCQLFQIHAAGIGVNSAGEAMARHFRLATREMVQANEEIGRYSKAPMPRLRLASCLFYRNGGSLASLPAPGGIIRTLP